MHKNKSIFNPLYEIFETQRQPHARTLRTSFIEKLLDTFFVFHGRYNTRGHLEHLGLYDYATLLIPFFLEKLIPWSYYLFEPVRLLSCAIATLAALPITAGIAAFSSWFAKPLIQNILNMPVLFNGSNLSVSEFLAQENACLPHLLVQIDMAPAAQGNSYTVMLSLFEDIDKTATVKLTNIDQLTPDFPENDKVILGVSSLFKLNINNILSRLEEKGKEEVELLINQLS